MLVVAMAIAFFAPNNQEIFRLAERPERSVETAVPARRWNSSVAWALVSAVVFAGALLYLDNLSEFLYFKF
jgi:hypothetical protein